MSKFRSDRKPPLARSPIQLRSRRVQRSTASTGQSLPGSLTKTQLPTRGWDIDEWELRPEYRSISCELQALAKMVNDEFGNADLGNVGFATTFHAVSSPLFERGRFYDEYSARRNERIKRKKVETGDKRKSVYDLGVKVESAKRRDLKKFEGLRKSIPSTPMTDRREIPRYSLRSSSSKENKNTHTPLAAVNIVDGSDRKPDPDGLVLFSHNRAGVVIKYREDTKAKEPQFQVVQLQKFSHYPILGAVSASKSSRSTPK
ncbi:hypothetical protein F0562_036177 [Nyssa sinensis]|uniref:Uncharacterized protein n=1 Tax=Nyssa sinensis TaxID=561372 RepID=A0A5J5AG61_9ASTE|nr:hypothetical protein F0562_036177 [Nyssa sinensis]